MRSCKGSKLGMRLALLTTCLVLLGCQAAQAGCGHVRLAPRESLSGVAPLAIGDSVMYGAAWKLSHRGFEVDAVCGQSPAGGLYMLRQRLRRGTLPEIVVVALGTALAPTSRDISRMLRVLGPRRTLMLVTPFRMWRPFGGAAIRRAARRHPRRIELIDWSSRARFNHQWFWPDGTHLRDSGELAYAHLLHRHAWSRLRGRFG
jgi:hypothetical protein